MRKLSSSDRSALIKLASSLPLLKTADDTTPMGQAEDLVNHIKSGINTPYLNTAIYTLGGRPSVGVNISFDPKPEWKNGIFENSRYGKFMINIQESYIELLSRYGVEKFRKTKFRNANDAVAKLNNWVSLHSNIHSLTASDRSALIKLASSLPAGSTERRTILAGLQQKRAAGQTNIPNVHIFDKAKVYDEAEVSGDAKVYGRAEVLDNAKVFGNAEVFEKAGVFGDAKVFGNAKVRGMAQVNGKAKVSDTAQLYDNAEVYGNADVNGNAKVFGNAEVYERARVHGDAKISGKAHIFGDADISGTAVILGGNWDGSEGPITSGKWAGPDIPA